MTAERVTRGMTGEMGVCAAAVFRLLGKDVATENEFVMEVSLGQKWFPPTEARALLDALAAAGAVEVRDGYVRPAGDTLGIDVPLGYRPPRDILTRTARSERGDRPPSDPFPALVGAAEAAGVPRREFIQECNRIHRVLGIDISAAALVALRDSGVDIRPHVALVRSWVSAPVAPS